MRRGHGQASHADSGGVVEGVADGRGQRDHPGRFADSGGIGRALRYVVLDEHDFDFGCLARSEYLVALEVGIHHGALAAIHDALFEERIGDALNDSAVDLVDDAERIHGTAAVVDAEDALDVDPAGFGINGQLDIIDAAVGDPVPRVVGNASCPR